MRRWEPGDHVVLQDVHRGRVYWALPVTEVADTDDFIALYLAVGTRCKDPNLAPGHLEEARIEKLVGLLDAGTWDYEDRTWLEQQFLMLIRPGQAHAIYVIWDEVWTFRGWYVNLEAPLRRVETGFQTTDHALDIVIAPDRTWTWKDIDE